MDKMPRQQVHPEGEIRTADPGAIDAPAGPQEKVGQQPGRPDGKVNEVMELGEGEPDGAPHYERESTRPSFPDDRTCGGAVRSRQAGTNQ